MANLKQVATSLVAPGKGILAADESTSTIKKRFDKIGVESNEKTRNEYRELLFTTEGISEFISGVILFDETIRYTSSKGVPFPRLLEKLGIIPGIKCDKGVETLPGTEGEKVTVGLDNLLEKLKEYYEIGARFAKWRAVITIGKSIPTALCIDANVFGLARYAAIAQKAGVVPIVEPEVLMDGDHDIARCEEVTLETLQKLFFELHKHHVDLEGILLKPNMVISGMDCPVQASVQEVAERTVRCFLKTVPAAVPGIVFLSGGQSSSLATEHLNAMNALKVKLPWELSFSYGRALQDAPLKAWKGKESNILEAKKKFHHCAKCNSLARYGKYSKEMDL